MATLSHFPPFFSLSSRNLSSLDQLHPKQLHCLGHLQHRPRRRECSVVCTCSIRKSRASRKTKSNEELCTDIREFFKSVGLPEDHVPSTKELSQHGRIDLANIVRRRGYKLIRELLTTNSTKTVEIDCDLENITLTGQDCEGRDVVDDPFSSNQVLVLENLSPSSNTYRAFSFGDCNSSPTTTANSSLEEGFSNDLECHDECIESHRENDENLEKIEKDASLKTEVTASVDCFCSSNIGLDVTEFSKDLSAENPEILLGCESEVIEDMVDESSLSPEDLSGENYKTNSTVDEYLDRHDHDDEILLLTIGSSKKETLYCSNEQEEIIVDNNVDNVSLSAEMTTVDDQSSDLNIGGAPEHEEYSYKLIKYSEELSLAEKVARFMQNGDLDMIDEETEINSHVEAFSEDTASRGSVMASNGSALEFEHIMSSTTVGQLVRDDQPSAEASNGQIDKVLLGAEIKRNENQLEIDRLKFMLHQNELELSQLKEQVKRDKLALSALQSKAETEISKAQKLILEKDTELLAAEESLSGLEEVHIHYLGEGENVEVAGSFNGWHHRIKMDPQPSSNVADSINSKTPMRWSSVLWLYPGVYEIKFVVDGHWKIDPHRESVTKGTISNNILRVER